MKKGLFILLGALFIMAQQTKAIELEPRTGMVYSQRWGLQAGALVGFKVTDLFFIQPGVQFYTGGDKHINDWDISINVPVYASFRLPISDVAKIRLNAGPYVGFASLGQLGVTAEAGVEFKRIYIGAGCYQNCINDTDTQLNLSIGYSFSL